MERNNCDTARAVLTHTRAREPAMPLHLDGSTAIVRSKTHSRERMLAKRRDSEVVTIRAPIDPRAGWRLRLDALPGAARRAHTAAEAEDSEWI
jgi:hypothetical protein